jgi:hypothetical protein
MADVTSRRIDEMETLYHGVARRARAELGARPPDARQPARRGRRAAGDAAARRGLPRYEPRAALTTWLHRIATNVALPMLEQRRPAESLDALLQAYPDRLIDELPTPEEQAIARERLGLAHVVELFRQLGLPTRHA